MTETNKSDKPETPEEPKIPPEPTQDQDKELDDPKTDQAVDDITVHESDELLSHQDATAAERQPVPLRGNFFSRWWHSKRARWITFGVVAVAMITLMWIPATRYWILNALGVRGSCSVTAVDDLTTQPLKNVQVTIDNKTMKTDSAGHAKLTGLKLGPTQLKLERAGFATHTEDLTIGWGSNPQGNVGLKSVGIQYKLLVRDVLTAQPIGNVEASSGEATAVSDKDGKIVLTLSDNGNQDTEVTVSKGGYRSEKVIIKGQTTDVTNVNLLTSQKAVYVAKDSAGKYNVYSSDVDGQNRKLVLAGTGTETANMALAVSPSGDHAALVSTRDNQRDADGFLLTTLTLINLEDNTSVALAHAEQIQLVDWIGTHLIFEQVASDASSPATRYGVVSFDYAKNSRVQLASGRHLNTVLSAHGAIYYALAADPQDTQVHAAMYKVNPDSGGKQIVLDKEVWTTYRTDYNTLSMQTADGWYSLNIASGATAALSAPSSYSSRLYADNADATQSLWVDTGQGALRAYRVVEAKDTIAHTQSGLTYPVRWLTSTTAIYRVVTGGETADYAVSTLGGQAPMKIADVTNAFGFTQGQ